MRRVIVLSLLLPSLALAGQPVYRSQDEEGRVIYSAQPPTDAVKTETLTLPPAPPEDEVRRAEERLRKLHEFGERLERERQQREAQEAERRRKEDEAAAVIGPGRMHPIPAIVPQLPDNATSTPPTEAAPGGVPIR